MYIIKLKASGKYYNKVSKEFDASREGASIVMEEEMRMIVYKYDDSVTVESI